MPIGHNVATGGGSNNPYDDGKLYSKEEFEQALSDYLKKIEEEYQSRNVKTSFFPSLFPFEKSQIEKVKAALKEGNTDKVLRLTFLESPFWSQNLQEMFGTHRARLLNSLREEKKKEKEKIKPMKDEEGFDLDEITEMKKMQGEKKEKEEVEVGELAKQKGKQEAEVGKSDKQEDTCLVM